MQNSQNKKKLQIVLLVLVAVLTLGIGYASITAVNLIINGNGTATANQENFKVYFTASSITEGKGTVSIDDDDPTIGYFDITGLSKVGDEATATYTVLNNSNGVGAAISLSVTNSNSEYFKVTETIQDNKLQAGEDTTATVKVEMIKTPLNDVVSTSVSATLKATPIEDADATGESPASKQIPTAFEGDSWATIKTNVQNGNTSQYNIGDTKKVTINGTDYRVRIANKTTGEHCGDNDSEYSQTACGFVVEFAEVVEKRAMKSTKTNIGGYPATLVYNYLKNTLYSQLPSDLQAAIKPTRVISGHGSYDADNFTTTDKLYLLSTEEVYGIDDGQDHFSDTAYGTSHQLEYYSNNGVTYSTKSYSGTNIDKAIKQYNSSNSYWWLRSAYSSNIDFFRYVNIDGSWNAYYAHNTFGVAPAFRIG